MLTITFLGTGTSQGIPIIGSRHPVCLSNDPKDKRLRVSISIEWENYYYVVDCGPDFRQQMLTQNVRHLDGVLFTHEHADHTAGLDDIRPFFFRQGKVQMYMRQDVHQALKKRFSYIFNEENKYPGAPSVQVTEVGKEAPFVLGKETVIPVEALHAHLPVLGYRIRNFAYMTDVKSLASTEKDKLHNLDVLVINALREEPHPSHLNLEEALDLVKELQPKRTYFTHISHLLGFHKEVEAKLPSKVYLAYDNLKITV